MNTNLTFIYDGECPFCNHFAELLELKSKINKISILDGRKNVVALREVIFMKARGAKGFNNI